MEEQRPCAICDCVYYTTQGNITKTVIEKPVQKLGINSLIERSKKYDDNKWKQWENETLLYVHANCRQAYCQRNCPRTPTKTKELTTSTADPTVLCADPDGRFHFQTFCFLCGQKWDDKTGQVINRVFLERRLLDTINQLNEDSILRKRVANTTSLIKSQARFHDICYESFWVESKQIQKEGKKKTNGTFDEVCAHLEKKRPDPVFLSDLKQMMGINCIETQTLYRRLRKKYGEDISIDQHPGRDTKIYFKDFILSKMYSNWLVDESSLKEEEISFILKFSAEILSKNIKSKKYDLDCYNTPEKFFSTVKDDIPELLLFFLKNLTENHNRNIINPIRIHNLAHIISTLLRPNSFSSHLHLALGAYIHRKTGSKLILDILSALGVCCSYRSVRLFKESLSDPKSTTIDDAFTQLVFEKNVATQGEARAEDSFFEQIASLLTTEDITRDALKYELSPYPLSLFTAKGFMRQPDKSFYPFIKRTNNSMTTRGNDLTLVIDGNHLVLNAISSWPHGKTYKDICELYSNFVKEKYPDQLKSKNLYIVFEHYNDELCGVKSYAQHRRNKENIAANFHFNSKALVNSTKKEFLSNVCNKIEFVKLLSNYLKEEMTVIMSLNDCTTEVVNTAIKLKSLHRGPVGVVSDSIDIMVLLITLTPDNEHDMFFCKDILSENQIEFCPTSEYSDLRPFLLFVHTFNGCDSTSAIFNKGKTAFLKLIENDDELQNIAKVFYKTGCSSTEICVATEKLILRMYNTSKIHTESIDELRYERFLGTASSSGGMEKRLSMLPPTLLAAHEHGKRVYYQLQKWTGNLSLQPDQWGWKRIESGLIPVMTTNPPAPENFCDKISWG